MIDADNNAYDNGDVMMITMVVMIMMVMVVMLVDVRGDVMILW